MRALRHDGSSTIVRTVKVARRLGDIVRSELYGFSPRLHLGLALVAGLPDLTGVRLRAGVLRWSGVPIGPETVVGGRIRIVGGPAPGSRVTIGARGWINSGCYLDTSDVITIGDDVAIGQQVMVLTQSHVLAEHDRRAGPLITARARWSGQVSVPETGRPTAKTIKSQPAIQPTSTTRQFDVLD